MLYDVYMSTITITEIAMSGRDNALAAIEDLRIFGYVESTDPDAEAVIVTDDGERLLTVEQAITAIKQFIDG